MLWRDEAKTYFGNLAALAGKALAQAGLSRQARIGRADGRVLYLQVASADSKIAARAISVAGKVPGVLRVQLAKISVDAEEPVKEAGACNLLLQAVKADGRIRFLPKGAKIDKASHPLLKPDRQGDHTLQGVRG